MSFEQVAYSGVPDFCTRNLNVIKAPMPDPSYDPSIPQAPLASDLDASNFFREAGTPSPMVLSARPKGSQTPTKR